VVARAQQDDRVRRIGVLAPYDENDPEGKRHLSAFTQGFADLGWIDRDNVQMDLRFAGADINRIRTLARELVGLQPDILLALAVPATIALQRETRTIPIVFITVGDPVALGIVARLDRPSGNTTGFGISEPSLGGKWLELLAEVAPGLKRAAIMFNPDTGPYRLLCPHLRRRPGHSSSCQALRTSIATLKSRPPSLPSGGSLQTETHRAL
jgi:putative ABC transport system substrate-binding protein